MNLLSGKLRVADLAANVITYNFSSFMYMIWLGVSIPTGVLVGNSIGEEKTKSAKIYIKLGLV